MPSGPVKTRFLQERHDGATAVLARSYSLPGKTPARNVILCRYFSSSKPELCGSERMPFDLSNGIKLFMHIRLTRIWLDLVNGGGAGAKSKRRVCHVDNKPILVGEDGVADVFGGEGECNHSWSP